MNVIVLFSILIITVATAPSDSKVDYNALNKELDSILKASQNINSMTPSELVQLSARVDGTLKRLESIAEKRLGLQLDPVTMKRIQRSPQEQQQQEGGAAPIGQGPLAGLAGLGGTSNLLQMLSQMFASLGQNQETKRTEKQD